MVTVVERVREDFGRKFCLQTTQQRFFDDSKTLLLSLIQHNVKTPHQLCSRIRPSREIPAYLNCW
jgi:hypothetical protein